MSDPSINMASLSLSKKALSKLLQSKISAEILELTGLKKLPDHIRKTIKKAGKKISSELHSGAGDDGNSQQNAAPVKSHGDKHSPKEAGKVKAAKNEVKKAKPAVAKKAVKIAKPRVVKKAASKASVAKKPVKKAVPKNDSPAENTESTQ
jgi:hypothetical protein